jgi:hypothetical protein
MAQEIKIFRPTLIDEKPLPLGSEEFSYAPKLQQASQDGMIKVKLEEEVIIQRVSHDLYANPKSGFREFYNNECRACRTASRVFGANSSIEVTLVPSERRLVIQGVDSLGISQDKFLQVYSVLGRSDNFSGEEIGLFGLGRNSYTTLSDTMVLETWSREDEMQYAVMGKNGIAYNLLPKPNLDSHGTRVTFVLDQKVPILDMLDYIVDCTAFSGIDTFLNLAEKIELPSYWRSDFPSEKGRYKLGPNRFDEYLEQKVRKANKWHEVVKYLPIRVEDEDFELYAAFVVRKDYNGLAATEESDEREVRLLGTPVEATRMDLPFSAWILNIKNERKYPPTADRERLAEQSTRAIQQKVQSRISETIASLGVTSTREYSTSTYREVLKAYRTLGLETFLPPETLDVCRFVNLKVKCFGEREKKDVSELLGQEGTLFYLPTLNGRKVGLIRSVLPEAVVFRLATERDSDSTPLDERVDLLLRNGVRLADEFLKENKPKLKPQEIPMGDLAIHSAGTTYFSWGRFETVRRHVTRVEATPLDEMTVRIPKGKMQPYLWLLSTFKTDYRLVKDERRIEGGRTLEDFTKELRGKKVVTNHGRMTFEEIAQETHKPELLLYSDPRIAAHFSDREGMMVFGGDNLLFELAAFLTRNGVKYDTDLSGHTEFKNLEPEKLYPSHFVGYASYEKLGDSEILYSVLHVVKEVKDGRLRELFLNAAQWSKNAEEVAKMRKDALSLDRQISE